MDYKENYYKKPVFSKIIKLDEEVSKRCQKCNVEIIKCSRENIEEIFNFWWDSIEVDASGKKLLQIDTVVENSKLSLLFRVEIANYKMPIFNILVQHNKKKTGIHYQLQFPSSDFLKKDIKQFSTETNKRMHQIIKKYRDKLNRSGKSFSLENFVPLAVKKSLELYIKELIDVIKKD